MNPMLLTDFYKVGHPFQYPDGTSLVFSNLTPRKSRLSGVDEMVFFGLQRVVKLYLIDVFNMWFFKRPLAEVLEEYKTTVQTSLGGDLPSYEHIEKLHKLGYLPIRIDALPEGSVVPMRVPVFTIYNTHPDFYWVTNFLETLISAEIWQACTSATIAREYRKILDKWAEKTGMPKEFVNFQAHDFSMRGMSSVNSAMISGMGHLLYFTGTDTIPAILGHQVFYNADPKKEFIGGSIPATEHSVMCAGGKEDEIETYRRLIQDVYPNGLVSIVSDTWDLWKVLTDYNVQLKNTILSRDGKVVFRPDSGDPVDIICGEIIPGSDYRDIVESRDLDQSHPKYKGVVELLWEVFGGTVNEKGYKVLDSHVGVIYGDSITLQRAEEICKRLEAKGFASQCVLGVGSYTYQYNTRDTFGMAIKATYVEKSEITDSYKNGESIDAQYETVGYPIFKDPVTDDGTKKSARGLLKVVKQDGAFVLKDNIEWNEYHQADNELKPIFKDGKLLVDDSLSEIRKRAAI